EKIYNDRDRAQNPHRLKEYDFSGKRTLLVEDHLLNIEVAKKLLGAKKMQVEVAENGLQAIEIFAQKDAGYFDVILMDIRMPVMDGLTAAKSIRQMRKADAKTIPIIAMTANAFEEDIEKTKTAGMNAHLTKPIEPELLYQTMQSFLERKD
ncbi:MAG: response regulator, partial [Oscillospiraceae bacterium]